MDKQASQTPGTRAGALDIASASAAVTQRCNQKDATGSQTAGGAAAPCPSAAEQRVLDLILQGEAFFRGGDTGQAMAMFQSAIDISPAHAHAHSNMGVLYWQAGEAQRAVQHWSIAFDTDPADRTVVLNLGDALCVLGKYDMALRVFSRFHELNPGDAEVNGLVCMLCAQAQPAMNANDARATALPVCAAAGLDTLTPDNFKDFTYSKRSHFSSLVLPIFHRDKKMDNCDLKVIQDTLILNFLLSNLPRGARILEVGGGRSRIIGMLRNYYECWNLDKFEGSGNGLTTPQVIAGTRLVTDYIGNFNQDLPVDYFDCVYSISTLEHVPEDEATYRNIANDINRVLRPGGYSVHCLDIVKRQDHVWTNGLLHYLYLHVAMINPEIAFHELAADPDLYVLSEQYYTRCWQPVTKRTFVEFGEPLSYNVIWKK
jgi:Flp pilus assembly protein TadD/SAM-dependent methyltransferase